MSFPAPYPADRAFAPCSGPCLDLGNLVPEAGAGQPFPRRPGSLTPPRAERAKLECAVFSTEWHLAPQDATHLDLCAWEAFAGRGVHPCLETNLECPLDSDTSHTRVLSQGPFGLQTELPPGRRRYSMARGPLRPSDPGRSGQRNPGGKGVKPGMVLGFQRADAHAGCSGP